ncbi:MAG TPA: PAS domain-containing protein [Dongiaceae bacterium]|nr:PAS domain-containing protein [Dongiaceae bacterium]
MNVLPLLKSAPDQVTTCPWWNSLFNASEDAQIVCRTNGLTTAINPKAARLFKLNPGRDEGELSVFQLLSPPADQKLAHALQHGLARPDTLHSVPTLRHGAPHTLVDLEIIPLDEAHTLLTFRDASRRLRLESHVQRLVTAIDATPDVFFLADADLRLTFVNPAFQSSTGYNIEEVLGRPDEFLRAPGELTKVREYLACVAQGQEWIGELMNRRRDGTLYPVEATISPISNLAGQFMGYVACERDITERKQLEAEIRSQHDFVHSILHSLDGAIYSIDREFRLTHANDGWRQLPTEHGGFRFAGPPDMGRALLDYVPEPARREELRAIFQEVLTTGHASDNRFHAPDGRHWLVKVSPWVDDRQKVRGLICSIADQTHFHELQNQLFQAQKMEIIGTLAAGVAHDFNNLLQAIRGNSGLILLQAAPDSKLRREVEQIDIAASRAADITQQLLSFSRESEEKRTVLDLNQIIQEAAQLAHRTLRGNVTLDLQPAAKPLLVKMDSTRASQALLNLCVNAQDAMPEGGRLTLTNRMVILPPELARKHSQAMGAPFALCSVTDTGTGIPPEVMARIFQPFFTTKGKGKGTGLGLAIVRRAVQEAGGFIEADSTVGRGTTFHLYLPLAQEKTATPAAAAPQPLSHGSGCVLVVDDMDLLRDFTCSFLKTAGFTVLVAGSGAEALQVLESATHPVDLLFTDFNMPGMNGAELIDQVAARWPQIKLILVSGYLEAAIEERVAKLNVSVLAKPYDMRSATDVIVRKISGCTGSK